MTLMRYSSYRIMATDEFFSVADSTDELALTHELAAEERFLTF